MQFIWTTWLHIIVIWKFKNLGIQCSKEILWKIMRMPWLCLELGDYAKGVLYANMSVTAVDRTVVGRGLILYHLLKNYHLTRFSKTNQALCHLWDKFLPATSLTNVIQGQHIRVWTIKWRLHLTDLHPRHWYRDLILAHCQRWECLRRCHLHWRFNNKWSYVLFSDDTWFNH